MQKIAVIDLGTNTFHLKIVELTDEGYIELHKEKSAVKLGEGGISNGIIADAALQRAIQTLKRFKNSIDSHQTDQIWALGTSALRSAKNSDEVVQTIFDQTGIQIQVISGKVEAELIYRGVRQAVSLKGEDRSLIMDIGGGSVEFIICDQHTTFWMQSYEIGGQRLMDLFHTSEPIATNSVLQLFTFLDKSLDSLRGAIAEFSPKILVGASGTFDTLCDIYHLEHGLNLKELDQETEFELPVDFFLRIHEELLVKTKEERMAIPGMIEMRVQMIVVASCLIHYIITQFDIQKMKSSTFSLKEGVIDSIIKKLPI